MRAPATRPAPGVWERESRELAFPPARGCPLPPRLRNRGKALLNQQFWLWGQDVRGEGNLLRRFGFAQIRPPTDTPGSNVYILPDGEMALWGFGLLARWPGSPEIFLGRFRFEPRIPPSGIEPREVWQPPQMAPLASPRGAAAWVAALKALIATVRWIAAYETWVAEAAGPAYRHNCLARWPRAACPAGETVSAWQSIADACEACLAPD